MNQYTLGFLIGLILALCIFLGNVVFPTVLVGNGLLMITFYVLLFLSFIFSGYVTSGEHVSLARGSFGGAIVAFISIEMAMLTLIIINNYFFDLISQQPYTVYAYQQQDTILSMKDFINYNVLNQVLYGLPLSLIVGGFFGLVGGFVKKYR